MLQNLFISRKKRKTLIFCGKSRTKTRTSLLHIAEPQWSNNRLKSPCHAPFWCFILSPGCIRVKKPAVMHYGRDFRLKSDVCHLWGGAEGKVEISHTVHCCLSLTAEPFIPEDRVSAVGILLFTPLTIWRNKQCSRKGLLLSISGSSPHPSSPQFQLIYIYIYIYHDLLSSQLLTELQVSLHYLGTQEFPIISVIRQSVTEPLVRNWTFFFFFSIFFCFFIYINRQRSAPTDASQK